MRTPSKIVAGLASAAVIGIGWQLGSAGLAPTTSTTATSSSGSTSGSTSSGTGTSTGTSTSTSTGTATGVTDGTYDGSVVQTRFGTVQVQVVISGGQITDVIAAKLTDDDRKSIQISNRAAPILRDEVLASQSANVSNVSGATYTTDAYLQSLQAALDAAGFTG